MRLPAFAIILGFCCAANAASFPSPEDWRDENIYFIFTDRFFDGDASNNNVESGRGAPYAPTNSRGLHGGDFKGIEKKLDYLKGLGASAIWITPVPLNVGGSAYHGYGAQDFYTLAPHWGSMQDLSNMVAAAHARGIKVMLDVVVNHSGNLIDSGDSGYPNFSTTGYNMRYRSSGSQHALPFNVTNATPQSFTSIFHNNGAIQDFNNLDQVERGELSSLDDFNTQLTYVRTNMANIYKHWIQVGDLDGFRIDTVKHVDHGNSGFWNYWCPQIHSFGSSIGKSNFFMFGEVFDGSDSKCGLYTGTKLSTNFALDSVLDYPLYFMVGGVFASATANTKQIEDHYNAIPANYDPAAQTRLVTFLDNHDQRRFLNVNSSTNRLNVALTFLYTARGVPCLYYGTEQAFNGSTDPNNREDMFDGVFEQTASLGDNFNETHPLFRRVALLNNFRRNYVALRRGDHLNQWNNASGPGLFAYSRRYQTQDVFVVLNTAGSSQTVPARSTIYPAGTKLVNLFNTNETVTVDSTPNIPAINVPGTSAKMFVAQSQFQPLDPVVATAAPVNAVTNVNASAAVVLTFSKAMDTNSVQTAFSIAPGRAGTFAWNTVRNTMTFTPSAPLTGTTNIVRVATNAFDSVDGKFSFAPYESYFVTAGTAGADTTPPTVAISLPLAAAVITGTLNVSGTASDVGGTVAKVEVQLDSGNWTLATGTTSWSLSLDSTRFLNGSHALSARSTDSSGNVSSVDSRTIRFFNVPNGYLQRISAGNPSNVTDCASIVWVADQAYSVGSFGYSGGTNGFITSVISNTCATAQPLYQRERYSDSSSSFRYLFDCPEGIYETTLLEAETFTNTVNGRLFNVFIEGEQVLTNFDIFATAGGKSVPITLTFTNTVADAQLEIQYFAITGLDNARASGIQARKIGDVDSDADGIPDWWMLAYFDHPTGQDADSSMANQDADGDGLTNLQEFQAGTDPLVTTPTNVTASFTGSPTNGPAPLLVNFTDTSTGPITNRFWNYGDGNSGTNTSHTYTTTSTNTVTLIVTGILGDISTNTRSNYISAGGPPLPDAPSNLTATNVYENQVSLTWHDNSTNETGFAIQRAATGSGPWSTVNSVASGVTNFIECSLAGGTTYFYQVLATNAVGSSLPSNIASITTPATNSFMAYDRASESAYAGGWTNGSNGGVGFGTWTLVKGATGGTTNGFFIGSSGSNAGGGGITIDSCGTSFGLYANSGSSAVGYRTLGGTALAVGQSLRWRMDNGLIDNNNSVGLVLRTANTTNTVDNYNTSARFEFFFLGGTNNYLIVDGAGSRDTGVGWSSQALELEFTLTDTNTYALHVARLENGFTTTLTGTLGGTAGSSIDSLAAYNRNAGAGSQYDTFFNYFARIAQPPVALFTATPTNGPAPLAVTFTDTSTGPITSRFWDFGDGVMSNTTVAGVQHAYNMPGTNTVTLIVTGLGGVSTNMKPSYIVVTNIVDSVGDGIPDTWRQQYFGGDGTTTNNQSCASCDPDGDGTSNLTEYLAGTDPLDQNSAFQITGIEIVGNDVLVRWTTRSGKSYQLRRCDTPDTGSPCLDIGSPVPGTGSIVTQLDSGAATNAPPLFYRVRLAS